jgi:glycosyltransferase involved in cell wall biosynthesis
MRILYTHDIFTRQRVGGISRYYVELIRHLAEGPAEIQVPAGLHANEHLRELEGHPSLLGQYQSRSKPIRLYGQLRNRVKLSSRAKADPPHIAHHTYYSWTRPLKSARLVVTVHDLIPERFPREFGWKAGLLSAAKLRSCLVADRILAISETTKNDLVQHYAIPPEKIDVTWLGNSLAKLIDHKTAPPQEAPYLFYVGARGGYKNCKRLWEAYARSLRLKHNFHLVCFGGGDWTAAERRLLEEFKIAPLVHQVSGDDRLLARYYRHAAAFVCPSLYEGFGIPLVEAMGFGCPIITSFGGALPEIAGPAAAYFDPRDTEMLAATLENVLFSDSLQTRLKSEMKRRESKFRWEETARQTMEAYEKAAA